MDILFTDVDTHETISVENSDAEDLAWFINDRGYGSHPLQEFSIKIKGLKSKLAELLIDALEYSFDYVTKNQMDLIAIQLKKICDMNTKQIIELCMAINVFKSDLKKSVNAVIAEQVKSFDSIEAFLAYTGDNIDLYRQPNGKLNMLKIKRVYNIQSYGKKYYYVEA